MSMLNFCLVRPMGKTLTATVGPSIWMNCDGEWLLVQLISVLHLMEMLTGHCLLQKMVIWLTVTLFYFWLPNTFPKIIVFLKKP